MLYEGFVEKIERELSAGISQISVPIQIFYEHLEAEEQFYRVLFSSLGTQTVVKRLTRYISERMSNQLAVMPIPMNPDIPLDIVSNHLASAQIGLGIWWLEQNKPYPAEQMTELSMALSLNGVVGVLGQ